MVEREGRRGRWRDVRGGEQIVAEEEGWKSKRERKRKGRQDEKVRSSKKEE